MSELFRNIFKERRRLHGIESGHEGRTVVLADLELTHIVHRLVEDADGVLDALDVIDVDDVSLVYLDEVGGVV